MTKEGPALLQYLKTKGISMMTLAKQLGMSRQNLYVIVEKPELDEGLKLRICKLLNISGKEIWGEGIFYPISEEDSRMMSTEIDTRQGIPLYPSYAHAGQLVGFADDEYSSLPRFSVPGFADCDVLVPVAGDSMYPDYTAGDIIACKRILEPSFIQWGHAHLIETPQGLLLKNLEPDEANDAMVYMESANPRFKPIHILKIEMKKLWIVKGKIKRNLL